MMEGRKPEYPEKTQDIELQKLLHTKAQSKTTYRSFAPNPPYPPADPPLRSAMVGCPARDATRPTSGHCDPRATAFDATLASIVQHILNPRLSIPSLKSDSKQ